MIHSKITVNKPTHFVSHTYVLLDQRDKDGNQFTKRTRVSRRQCKATRAFFTVQEAYGKR